MMGKFIWRFNLQHILAVTTFIAIWSSLQMPHQIWARIGIELSLLCLSIGVLLAACRHTQRAQRAFFIGAFIPPAMLTVLAILKPTWTINALLASNLALGSPAVAYWTAIASRLSWFWIPMSFLTGLVSLAIYSLLRRQSPSKVHSLFVFLLASVSVTARSDEKPWPFCVPLNQDPPQVKSSNWVINDIDRFVLSRLEQHGLQPAPPASKRTLLRRLYLDLIGLPPSPVEIQQFIDDESSEAYAKVVNGLLDDERYGERWARRWLDLARYADTAGYEGDPDLPHAWRYRDYVIDAFNQDKPYDLFIKEQIAGDELDEIMGAGELPLSKPEHIVALTFLRLAPFTEPRGDETRHELLSEMTSTVGSVFLGLTVGCAKCHDHRHDDISTADFYRLKAFFATVQIPPPERGDAFQIGGSIAADFYRTGEQEWADKRRTEIRQQMDVAKNELQQLKNAIAQRLGQEKVDDLLKRGDERITQVEKDLYERLSAIPRFLDQDLKRLEPMAMSLRHSFGPPYEPGVPVTRIMQRGEYDNPGDVVEAGFLSAITGNQDPAPIRLDPFRRWPTRSRRMALANWIASPHNPMTARVMVNRLWHWHFGQGIVRTPSDFGQLSGGPSHQELLDWLALKFIDEKWSIKAMHRLIVQSATYQQSSIHTNEVAFTIDPDNRLLWRFNRQRLDAEAIRDSVLLASGRLNNEKYGLPIFPPLPGDVAEALKFNNSKWNAQHGPEGRRRSIYIYQQRTLTMPLMQSFDALVCDESRPSRDASITPLQALALLNGDFTNEEAKHFAIRVTQSGNGELTDQIKLAFEIALGRLPTNPELERMFSMCTSSEAESNRLVSLCRVLLNANEFIYVD
jgi:hypothetical protein